MLFKLLKEFFILEIIRSQLLANIYYFWQNILLLRVWSKRIKLRMTHFFGNFLPENCEFGSFRLFLCLQLLNMPLSINQFQKCSLVKITCLVIFRVVDSLVIKCLFEAVDFNIKLTFKNIDILANTHKLFQFWFIRKLLNHWADSFSNKWNWIVQRRAINYFLCHSQAHFNWKNVFGSYDLIDEICELFGLDKVLEKFIIKEGYYFIN